MSACALIKERGGVQYQVTNGDRILGIKVGRGGKWGDNKSARSNGILFPLLKRRKKMLAHSSRSNNNNNSNSNKSNNSSSSSNNNNNNSN